MAVQRPPLSGARRTVSTTVEKWVSVRVEVDLLEVSTEDLLAELWSRVDNEDLEQDIISALADFSPSSVMDQLENARRYTPNRFEEIYGNLLTKYTGRIA